MSGGEMDSSSDNGDGAIGAKEIGTFFIQQYYDVLQKDPRFACRFYNEGSHLVFVNRIDPGCTETATTLKAINDILMTLDFESVVIDKIVSVDSWNGGILVVLSGCMDSAIKGESVCVRRNFMQTVFLAPQNKGYYVESDVVHYLEVGFIEEKDVGITVDASSEGSEQSAVDEQEPEKSFEAEASYTDRSSHKQDHEHYNEPESVKEEAPLEVSSPTQQSDPHPAHISLAAEPVTEPPKFSYASIVQKGVPAKAASIQPSYVKKAPQPAAQQQRPASVASRPASVVSDKAEGSSVRSLPSGKSVYVKNLPPGISKHEVLEEFQQFGKIKQDGIFVKTSLETGFCYGFVDFEDSESAENAVKVSPLRFGERQVYIEFKKAGTSPSGPPPRGGKGGGGRGRGGGERGNTNARY